MQLREYQQTLISESRQALSKHKHIIVQSPTGSGKGVLIGSMASMSTAKHNRVLILAHSEEILRQDAGHARKWGVDVAEVYAKTRKMPENDCCCMMVQTLRQRLKKDSWRAWFDEFKFMILDECHRSEFDVIFEYVNPRVYVVGLSASPARYGQMRQLGLDYEAIVTGPSVRSLIDQGYLCKCRLFSLDAPSMEDVEWSYARGDYNLSAMAAKFKSKARYVGAVDNYERLCKGQKCLVFCCSSEQTINLTREFCERGIEAKYCLSGDFDEDEEYSGERKDVVDAFARGEFPVLVNYGLFTTGIDIPDIKVVMLMFSTTSLVKYMQVLGRGSRIADGKNGEFLCLDFGCNYERLGRYEDDRVWSVWHSTGAGGGVPPVKECPQCHKLVPVSWKDCAFCGYHWPTQQETYIAELREIAENNEEESVAGYVSRMKLEGKNTNWILVNICLKNSKDMKGAFMEAAGIMGLKPTYWYFFKKNILSKVKVKQAQDSSPKLF